MRIALIAALIVFASPALALPTFDDLDIPMATRDGDRYVDAVTRGESCEAARIALEIRQRYQLYVLQAETDGNATVAGTVVPLGGRDLMEVRQAIVVWDTSFEGAQLKCK